MRNTVTQKPFNSDIHSYDENKGAIFRQFISELLVRPEVRRVDSFQIVGTGAGTFMIFAICEIYNQQMEADPFEEEEVEEDTEYFIGRATAPQVAIR